MVNLIDANKIVENLWQGSRPPHGDYVKNAGFLWLVSCELGYTPTVDHYPGVNIILCPLRDCYDPTEAEIGQAKIAASLAAVAFRMGHAVLVHCGAGLNRSGLVTALILRERYEMSGEDAINLVRACRLNALFNEKFCQIIKETEIPL